MQNGADVCIYFFTDIYFNNEYYFLNNIYAFLFPLMQDKVNEINVKIIFKIK